MSGESGVRFLRLRTLRCGIGEIGGNSPIAQVAGVVMVQYCFVLRRTAALVMFPPLVENVIFASANLRFAWRARIYHMYLQAFVGYIFGEHFFESILRRTFW